MAVEEILPASVRVKSMTQKSANVSNSLIVIERCENDSLMLSATENALVLHSPLEDFLPSVEATQLVVRSGEGFHEVAAFLGVF